MYLALQAKCSYGSNHINLRGLSLSLWRISLPLSHPSAVVFPNFQKTLFPFIVMQMISKSTSPWIWISSLPENHLFRSRRTGDRVIFKLQAQWPKWWKGIIHKMQTETWREGFKKTRWTTSLAPRDRNESYWRGTWVGERTQFTAGSTLSEAWWVRLMVIKKKKKKWSELRWTGPFEMMEKTSHAVQLKGKDEAG